MQLSDAGEFNAMLERCGVIFSKPPDAQVCRAYFEALKDLPLRTVRECVAAHTANGKYFPKPFELRPKRPPSSAGSESAFPPLFSPAWWDQRATMLRTMSPNYPGKAALDSLDLATFGKQPTPELRAAANACYQIAWPGQHSADQGEQW